VTRQANATEATTVLDARVPADAARLGETRHLEREGLHLLGGAEAAHVVVVETRGCEPERAARLVPFLRQMLAEGG
jgi:hypothetical protein